jgi:hypothetical protein
LEQWEALVLFMTDAAYSEKSLEAQGILRDMKNPYNKLYLRFLEFILPEITGFNEGFQSSKVKIHELNKQIIIMYRRFLGYYMNSVYIRSKNALNIDPASQLDMLTVDKVFLGPGIGNSLSELPDKKANGEFIERCRGFLIEACLQMKSRFPFDSPALIAADKLNIHNVFNGSTPSFVDGILPAFPGLCNDREIQLKIEQQWRNLQFDDNLNKDLPFEDFWQKVMNNSFYVICS